MVFAVSRCHNYDLDSPLDRETGLDIFKVDPEYEQHEAEYKVGFQAPMRLDFLETRLICFQLRLPSSARTSFYGTG